MAFFRVQFWVIALVATLPSIAMAAPKKALAPTANARSLPVFEFMGQNTETPSTMQALNGNACTTADEKTRCADYGNPTLAGRPMRYITMEFYRGKLSVVLVSFGQYARSDVLDALVAKYGKPDSVTTEKWQSKAGATFDNQVAIWRFKGGLLKYDEMGSRVDEGAFIFVSTENRAPDEAPKVDF